MSPRFINSIRTLIIIMSISGFFFFYFLPWVDLYNIITYARGHTVIIFGGHPRYHIIII